ncbi:L-alanine-DL-glutamate epimerase [Natronoarchaeum philippinense]|uniref:L-alanine-DL-glutamate epimerase n=1 Tax=Natronoarchaeum philippinense TaxID=558529 RepID=A0A285PE14_NATPI|nr:dipeptide epimerase [Natronoarchaeum philippinense]SNZ18111.1 L-alanine-DL-glutamate epimerase [Natronoarchaeum philippinense]
MTLDADFETLSLDTERPFTIARGTTETVEYPLVRISDGEGNEGIGGAAPARHYGETAETVAAVLPDLLDAVAEVGDPHALARIERRLAEVVQRNPAARGAVSVALHDLAAKRAGLPLYRLWGLDPDRAPETSYTVGLDDVETMANHAREAVDRGFSTLKVKLGTDRDREIVRTIRSAAPDAALRVDANEAWSRAEAVRMAEFLADFGVELLEQPVPADEPDALRRVYEASPLPIAADESCIRLPDVPAVADRADVIVIKLSKCASLREARRMIHAAEANGLDAMLGCMVEANPSIAAMAHLAPLATYADLDGSLLLDDDPFDGVPMPDGEIDLAALDSPGTGVRER